MAGVFEEVALFFDEAGQFFRTDAPAEFDAAAHHAGVRAWDVEKDAIEVLDAGPAEAGTPCFGGAGDAETGAVFADQFQAGG